MTTPLCAARLRCELLDTPLGVDVPAPRLSWEVHGDGRERRQTAYRVRVASAPALLDGEAADLWDSGRVGSGDSAHVAYAGVPLRSAQSAWWSVQLWDESDRAGAPSSPARFEMGLLSPADWTASWIGAGARPRTHDGGRACPQLRGTFHLRRPVRRARAYVSALGVYELWCNGERAGDERLLPGWTDYRRRIPYTVHDLTALLHQGDNALGAVLGDGWYCGHVAFNGRRNFWGRSPSLCAQVLVEYDDGSREWLGTDSSWRLAFGAVLASDMQMGETYDARRELRGWSTPAYDDSGWRPVSVLRRPAAPLESRRCEPVRVTETLAPVAVTRTGAGTHLVDLGQNMVGWVRLRLHRLPRGTRIRLRFAEMLDGNGRIYTENYRAARCTDTYVARGDAVEEWEPSFTFRGFRYVEVSGHRGDLDAAQVEGRVAHTDAPVAGGFECSDPMLNRLWHNVLWGQRGNFLEVPTDCPQRDERLGWMGDAQIFAPTATLNMDVAAFYAKWLQDVADAQREDGAFADVAPEPPDCGTSASAPAWADAGVIVPWVMWERYADRALLQRQYPSMRRWVDHVHAANPDLLWRNGRGNDYGDWLSVEADTPKEVLATAFFARSAELLARSAGVLGIEEDARRYGALHDRIRSAFIGAHVDADGRVEGGTQCAHVLALRFGLVPPQLRERTAAHLVADIEKRDWHLSTGFVSVGHLLPVLDEMGRLDVAWRLLLQDSFPSWLFSIRHGATTIWERWDGWTPEKGFQTWHMNSFNHYSFGSVAEWIYDRAGGIALDPGAAGFARVLVRPRPGGGVTWARAWHRSIRGVVRTAWRVEDGVLHLDLEVPANTTARVVLPDGAGGERSVEAGSGAHRFSAPLSG